MVKQVINKQIEKFEYKEKKIILILFLISIFLSVSYGLLLVSITKNAFLKEKMGKEMAFLNTEVNSLEFQYLNIKNSITLLFAQSKGFVSISSDKFAVIDSTQKNISLSINEN